MKLFAGKDGDITFCSMKIAVNAYYLNKPAMGFGRYTLNFLEAVRTYSNPADYTLLCPAEIPDTVLAEWRDFTILGHPEQDRLTWGRQIGSFFDLSPYDLLYVPYNTAPETAIPCPLVLTIHDTIPAVPFSKLAIRHPSLLRFWNLDEYRQMRRELFHAQKADILTTVSHHARRDIARFLHFSPEEQENKLRVIYNTLSPDFRPAAPEAVRALKKQYDLPENYCLYLGGLRTRKNVFGMLRAFRKLPRRLQETFPLVIADNLPDRMQNYISRQKLPVQAVGQIPQADMCALYSGARLFVFLSFYEGFGLPPVEAAACGTPSLISTMASLPEVGEGFSLSVSPFKPGKAAILWKQLLEDQKLYSRLQEKCSIVHERFSRKQAIESLETLFEEIAEHRTF